MILAAGSKLFGEGSSGGNSHNQNYQFYIYLKYQITYKKAITSILPLPKVSFPVGFFTCAETKSHSSVCVWMPKYYR